MSDKGLTKTENDAGADTMRSPSMICAIIPRLKEMHYMEIVEGIRSLTEDKGYVLAIFVTDENAQMEKVVLDIAQKIGVKGIIISPAHTEDEFDRERFLTFQNLNVPTVLVERRITYSDFDGVFCDDREAFNASVGILLDEGHTNICVISGNRKINTTINSIKDIRHAFTLRGSELKESKCFFCRDGAEAYQTTLSILDAAERPSAIIACESNLTKECLRAISEKNLEIPKDISFIGYGNLSELELVDFPLTLIEKDASRMGHNAAMLLFERIEDLNKPRDKKRVIMFSEIVLRGSEKKNEGLK
jgi:DNA-binding LacI/PurR family transcriptional regulator